MKKCLGLYFFFNCTWVIRVDFPPQTYDVTPPFDVRCSDVITSEYLESSDSLEVSRVEWTNALINNGASSSRIRHWGNITLRYTLLVTVYHICVCSQSRYRRLRDHVMNDRTVTWSVFPAFGTCVGTHVSTHASCSVNNQHLLNI